MRAFADLLDTTAAATDDVTNRNLTTLATVKTALKIANTDSDTLISALIPRATALIVAGCRLARDAAGAKPTFARETLRATQGDKRLTAQLLGIATRTIYRKLAEERGASGDVTDDDDDPGA